MTIVTIACILLFLAEGLIALYFLVPFFMLLVHRLRIRKGGKRRIDRLPDLNNKNFRFHLIITAHEETAFLPPLLDSIRRQTYGEHVTYIVADCCDPSLNFDDARTVTLHPPQPLNSKIKSIEYAIASFREIPDAVIILDADNLIHPRFMETMNRYFRKGFRAVQADFRAKNTDSDFARMDAMGDLFNFFVEREMRMELGLSSAIWGAGIAFAYPLYEGIRYKDFLGGFDKMLQIHLASQVKQIAFAREAILYDEKITDGAALEKQRTRWISSQFKYKKANFAFLASALRSLNLNRIFFGYINVRPPLFMLLMLAGLFFIFHLFYQPVFSLVWAIILFLFALSFILIVRIRAGSHAFSRTFLQLPRFIIRQALATLKIKRASRSFLKTRHTKLVYITDLLRDAGDPLQED